MNITNVMENKDIAESVRVAIDALTTVTKKTAIEQVPSIKLANDDFRSVGLGAMDLHGFLAKNRIAYESEEAKDFANTFFMTMRYHSLQRSMELAKEHSPFVYFELSEYAKGTVLTKYIENSYAPKLPKVQALFEGITIPTQDDWKQLNEDIMENGLYHAYINAIAPTGSISYVNNATPSIMPITSRIETRTYGDSTTHYPMPYLSAQNWFLYKEAYDMSMFKLIDLMAVVQEHIDQSMSTTLYVDGDTITDGELARYYVYAHRKGLKTLYYTRTKASSNDECLSCTV